MMSSVQLVLVAGFKVSSGRSVVRLGGEELASCLCRCRGGTVDRSITLTVPVQLTNAEVSDGTGPGVVVRIHSGVLSRKVAFPSSLFNCWQVLFIDINLFIQVLFRTD